MTRRPAPPGPPARGRGGGPPGRPALWLGDRRGAAVDWTTQQWVRATGRRVDLAEAPWLDGPYQTHTLAPAQAGAVSFVPSESVLDHVVSSAALGDELPMDAVIPRLDDEYAGYENIVSDHLPVVVRLMVKQY